MSTPHLRATLALVSALALALCWSGPARAQDGVAVGLVAQGDCATDVDILGSGGEFLALHVDATPAAVDWQFDFSARGGQRAGFGEGDIEGSGYQLVGANFSQPPLDDHVFFTAATFPGGRVHLASSPSLGVQVHGIGLLQVVGDSPPGTTAVHLTGDRTGYGVDLGSGPVPYPRATPEGYEIAFAPLKDLQFDGEDETCHAGGATGHPDDGRGLVIGYSIYRMPDTRPETPTVAQVADPSNWIYFIPFHPDLEVPDALHATVNPDQEPHTGDEVIVFFDLVENTNGTPRQVGLPPNPVLQYWYAIQPVVRGEPSDWEDISIAGRPAESLAVDLDSDGILDAVDVDPAAGNGPEFISPQAAYGLPGLGLTNGGIALVSPLISTAEARDGGLVLRPGGESEIFVGWDETLGGEISLERGHLDALWQVGDYDHASEHCHLTEGSSAIEMPSFNAYYLIKDHEGTTSGGAPRPPGLGPDVCQ